MWKMIYKKKKNMHSLKLKDKTYILLEELRLFLLKDKAHFTRDEVISFALKALSQKLTTDHDTSA